MSSILIADSSRTAGLSGKARDAGVAPHEPDIMLVRLTPAPSEGAPTDSPAFPKAAIRKLRSETQRKDLCHATHVARNKRIRVTGKLDNWEEIRRADEEIKNRVAHHLPYYPGQFECSATAAGTTLRWTRDTEEANRIVIDSMKQMGESEVTKVKSMVIQETDLNEVLEREHITMRETDLAGLIVQLKHGRSSHVLIPTIYHNRGEVHEVLLREMGQYGTPCLPDVMDSPVELVGMARIHLREKFIRTRMGISGADSAVTEADSLMVVKSKGNRQMNLALSEALVSLVGIEKILPTFQNLEVFLQLLPYSPTGERITPYSTMWAGKCERDGPKDIHTVLLDNGRTKVLRDKLGHAALRCIRYSACLNICPVYEKMGGYAYSPVCPGPIGAILNPQSRRMCPTVDRSLPFASTLCGVYVEICPVQIPFADILMNLRRKVVGMKRNGPGHATHIEPLLMKDGGWVMGRGWRLALVGHLAEIARAPLRPSTRKIEK